MLDKIKLILGISETDEDSLLELYIDMVNDELEELLRHSDVKDTLKIKMVVFKYNRRGTEALSAYNYSGVAETFVEGYPEDIQASLRELKRKSRKVRFI